MKEKKVNLINNTKNGALNWTGTRINQTEIGIEYDTEILTKMNRKNKQNWDWKWNINRLKWRARTKNLTGNGSWGRCTQNWAKLRLRRTKYPTRNRTQSNPIQPKIEPNLTWYWLKNCTSEWEYDKNVEWQLNFTCFWSADGGWLETILIRTPRSAGSSFCQTAAFVSSSAIFIIKCFFFFFLQRFPMQFSMALLWSFQIKWFKWHQSG